MFQKLGVIGTGTIGGAMARLAAGKTGLYLSNRTEAKAKALADELPGASVASNVGIAQSCDLILLAVKPQMMPEVLKELAPALAARTDRFVLITPAAGLTVASVRAMAGGAYPVIRIMPNTPIAIGAGILAYCCEGVTDGELAAFRALFQEAGTLEPLPEHLMDAGSALFGCGPAFVDLFIEALADGGVACGLPRQKALTFAAQTVEGAARAVRLTGQHPGVMKDAVCSPAGSTIRGVRALEKGGFRSAAIEAVIAAFERNLELKQGK